MFEKGFTWGGFNPVHYGHLALFKTGLEYVNSVDVYIGKKTLGCRLPHEVRVKTIETLIYEEGLRERVNIIDSFLSLKDIDISVYQVLIAGSDLLNHMSPMDSSFKEKDRILIKKFDNIIMLERMGEPLLDLAREELLKSCSLLELDAVTSSSSTTVRAKKRRDEDISSMVPKYILPIIEEYGQIFNLEKIANIE